MGKSRYLPLECTDNGVKGNPEWDWTTAVTCHAAMDCKNRYERIFPSVFAINIFYCRFILILNKVVKKIVRRKISIYFRVRLGSEFSGPRAAARTDYGAECHG